MMKRNWTDNQLDAITARDGSVIVSAAAGSGKTAVLVERCMRLITDPDPQRRVDADRLLIVTFTRAAAAEMKGRLADELDKMIGSSSDCADLVRQQRLLSKAHICTVDSFCSSLVKEYFYILDVDRNFRIAESGELSVIRADAMRLTLDTLYAEKNESFYRVADIFSSARSDSRLENNIEGLYDFIRSHPFPQRWLDEKLAYYTDFGDVAESVWGRIIRDYTSDALRFMESLHDSGYEALMTVDDLVKKNDKLFESDREFLERLRAAVERERWDDIHSALGTFVSGRFSCPAGYKDHPAKITAAETRKVFKKIAEELKSIYSDTEAMCLYDIEIVKDYTEQIFRAVSLFDQNFSALKRERGVADYADLEHWIVDLLVDEHTLKPTAIAAEVSGRFDYILVDEYQDANETQEYIYRALSRDEKNLFVVGDVKQSIYGFRHAMPELFLRRKNSAKLYDRETPDYPAKIILDRNFRSEASVLRSVNYMFRKLMSESVGEIDYNEEEMLRPGADYAPPTEPAMEYDLIDKRSIGEENSVLAEADFAARRILSMIADGYRVKDREIYREAEFGDFAILLRNFSSIAPVYTQVLSRYGIPVSSDSDSGFLDAEEIMVMTNFLRVINNPALDIEMLSTVMSPVFGFTEDDMARIRVGKPRGSLYSAIIVDADNGNSKSRGFLDELGYYRRLSATVTLSKLINTIYQRSSYPDIMSAVDSTGICRNNLRMLLNYARKFEQDTHKGLSAFVTYLDKLVEYDSDLAAAKRDESASAFGVKLMSVHGSKGLEFPVVILANTYHRFVSDSTGTVLLHPKYGYAQKRYDPVLSASYNTFPRKALAIEISRSEKSEELRILYVALTRAKQKLILLSTPSGAVENYISGISNKLAGQRDIPPYLVRTASSMSDWITMCALLHPDGAKLREYASTEVDYERDSGFSFECNIISDSYNEDQPDEESVADDSIETEPAETKLIAELMKHAAFTYPYESVCKTPVKVAASTFAHKHSVRIQQRYLDRPAFLSEEKLNSAEKGTALHEFMQFADFAAARVDISAELERLVNGGYLTEVQAQSIDIARAQAFIDSDIVTRCLNSLSVYKEYRFNVRIPASVVSAEPDARTDEETVILQGAVDLAFVEDGELVIVDYKTDRVKDPSQLLDLYSVQLELYKDALTQCLELPVKECLIYSVYHSAQVDVYRK